VLISDKVLVFATPFSPEGGRDAVRELDVSGWSGYSEYWYTSSIPRQAAAGPRGECIWCYV